AGIAIGAAEAGVFMVIARAGPGRLRRHEVPDAIARPNSAIRDVAAAVPPVAQTSRMVNAEYRSFGRIDLALDQVHLEANGEITAQEFVRVVGVNRAGCAGVVGLIGG